MLRFEHPEWSNVQIGKELGITNQRVSAILTHPRVLAAMPLIGRQRIAGMVPQAAKAYEDLVKQNVNLQVKEKAAARILSDRKVLDAPEVKIVNEITLKDVCELRKIVSDAANFIPETVIDAEIVDDTTQDTTQNT